MISRDAIGPLVTDAIGDFNAEHQADKRLPAADDTVLLGGGGRLDSLGLVTLLVALEERLKGAGVELALADEMVASSHVPFTTVSSLVDFITALANRRQE